jgi:Spy/CpxP family protein refolding chaperone
MNSNPKRKAALYLAAVFVAGLVAGGMAGLTLARTVAPKPPPAELAENVRSRLKADLRLSDKQVRQISPIVDELMQEMQAEHDQTVERVVRIIRRKHQRMEQFLAPEQRSKFKQIEQEREEAFRRGARPHVQ